MNLAVWLCRLILGGTFMVSGAAKMIDPAGTSIKIEAYLAAWNLTVPDGLVLIGGCMLAMIEFLCGFLIATGSLRRTSVWCAAAIMAFMLPLTAYIAIANPVDDCGCFGDFLVISNTATFIKNIFLTAIVVFLLRYNRLCGGIFAPWSQWIQIVIAGVYMAATGIASFHVQPLIDFRAYPVGEPLTDSAGAEMRYIYKGPDGSMHEFTDDNLPDEDAGWEFIDVKEVAPASGKMFALFDRESGDDVTDRVLAADDLVMFLFPEPSAATAAGSYTANELNAFMTGRYGQGAFAGVTAADSAAVATALDLMMADYPVYYADPKAIKALARGDMAAVYLRNGKVMWKRKLSSINLDLLEKPGADPAKVYDPHSPRLFALFTLIFLAAEAILALLGLSLHFACTRLRK